MWFYDYMIHVFEAVAYDQSLIDMVKMTICCIDKYFFTVYFVFGANITKEWRNRLFVRDGAQKPNIFWLTRLNFKFDQKSYDLIH